MKNFGEIIILPVRLLCTLTGEEKMAAVTADKNQYYRFILDRVMVEIYGENLTWRLAYEDTQARVVKMGTRAKSSKFTITSEHTLRIIRGDIIIKAKSSQGIIYKGDIIIITTLK